MYSYSDERVLNILEGSYDLHVHPNPDTKVRAFDDYELLKDLDFLNMAGAVIKLQQGSTCGRAWIANKYSGAKARLYGSICMNHGVGGLNPVALEVAVEMGVKMVWMPTRSSAFDQTFNEESKRVEGLYILNEKGKLKKEVYAIMSIIKENDLIMSTGHLSLEETVALCKEARKMDIKTIMTHPEYERSYVPLDIQCEMAKLGVYIEKLWLMVIEINSKTQKPWISVEGMAESMKRIGADHVIMGSDGGPIGYLKAREHRGPFGYPTARENSYGFVETMLHQGISEQDLKIMMCRNNKELLGLE